MGRGARRRTVMGCAAAGCASSAAARRTTAAGATGRPASRGALVERSTSGSSRTGVGNARRISSITHPDGAVLEPTGSCLERPCGTGRFGAGRTRIERLGGPSARAGGATTDHRTRMERTPGRGLGRPEDRGTRGSTCALVVRAFGTALGARSRRATVERARTGGSSRAASMVTPG
jgi:hypothetical protein